MPVRKGNAEWNGTIREGKGTVALPSLGWEGPYSFGSRFEENPGTNPEELIAAAHAGCFSMALSGRLSKEGLTPTSIKTSAKVHIEKVPEGFGITLIELDTEGVVPGIDEAGFVAHAEAAKAGCPVSRALAAVEIRLSARLVS